MIDGVAVHFYLYGRRWGFRRMWQAPEVGDEVMFNDNDTYKVIERIWDVTGLEVDESLDRHPARCLIEPVKKKKEGSK